VPHASTSTQMRHVWVGEERWGDEWVEDCKGGHRGGTIGGEKTEGGSTSRGEGKMGTWGGTAWQILEAECDFAAPTFPKAKRMVFLPCHWMPHTGGRRENFC
jgi:hypothetical protein